jgi:hypothetical protein
MLFCLRSSPRKASERRSPYRGQCIGQSIIDNRKRKKYYDSMKYKDHSGSKAAARSLALIIILAFTFSIQPANAQMGENATFRLIGTIDGMLLSGAVLEDTAGKQVFYQLKEKLPDGSQIVKVQPRNIVVKGPDGIAYELYIVNRTNSSAANSSGMQSAAASPPSSVSDPFAGGRRVAPEERPQRAYDKRVQKLSGRQRPNDD